ncbi:Retaining alpha-galactosidase, partial [Bacteroides xylanisolvens]
MKRMMKRLLPVLMAIAPLTICAQKVYELKDISGKVQVNVIVNDKNVEYSVLHDNDVMVAPSPIFMKLTDGTAFGLNPKVKKISRRSVNETIYPPIYKKKSIKDQFNELTIDFKGGYSLVFRAYEDGAAYRFVSELKKPFMVESEQASFCFPNDPKVFVASPKGRMNEGKKDPFYSSFQNTYLETALSAWDKEQIAFLPVLVEGKNGKKICITEADLMNYPGMYVKHGEHGYSLDGIFAAYPKTIVDEVRGLKGVVKSREPYIARVEGNTAFPWRVMVIAKDDAELLCNDMVYKLATPAQFTDFSWIKPGKVAWDWWNDWNLYNVDFRAGINNETYKYYIDFASKFGIEYVILDEGWAVPGKADLFEVIPEIDLKELISYAKSKNVDLILWAGYRAFEKDMDRVCKHYAAMGIKGFKIDFMDRDDQQVVEFNRKAAETGAKYKLLIDLHGTFKPTGLQRTYPNTINFEGVHGLEEMKWAEPGTDQVIYDVTAPFIRMVAGPLDYTQGAMNNVIMKNFHAVYTEPMSQGTRCRQLALYTIFDSPINMLCDAPTN